MRLSRSHPTQTDGWPRRCRSSAGFTGHGKAQPKTCGCTSWRWAVLRRTTTTHGAPLSWQQDARAFSPKPGAWRTCGPRKATPGARLFTAKMRGTTTMTMDELSEAVRRLLQEIKQILGESAHEQA